MIRTTKEQRAEARRMWIAHLPASAIGVFLGRSVEAVYWLRHAEQWPTRVPRSPHGIDWVRGRTLWDAKSRAPEIAAALGTTMSSVFRAKHRFGWPDRQMMGPIPKPKKPKAPKPIKVAKVLPVMRHAPRPVEKIKGVPCACGSRLSRLVVENGLYVHRCSSCHPELPMQRAS